MLSYASMSDSPASKPVSQALLTAALGGLLCVATQACGGSSVAEATEDTPQPDTACPTGVDPNPKVTSLVAKPVSKSDFQSMCDARNGIFEIQPECGGSNSCRGMSYDTKTGTLSEHTCRATNTCAGYSCVVCD